jgi:NADH-quinone oxidoreductase subunit G
MPNETLPAVMQGRSPKILFNIHQTSEVNKPEIQLSLLEGPAHSDDFLQNKNKEDEQK